MGTAKVQEYAAGLSREHAVVEELTTRLLFCTDVRHPCREGKGQGARVGGDRRYQRILSLEEVSSVCGVFRSFFTSVN